MGTKKRKKSHLNGFQHYSNSQKVTMGRNHKMYI